MKPLFWYTVAFFLIVLIWQTSTYLGREGFETYVIVRQGGPHRRYRDWAGGPWWWHREPYWWNRWYEYGPCPGPWCPYR
jgi:hypothetical protein